MQYARHHVADTVLWVESDGPLVKRAAMRQGFITFVADRCEFACPDVSVPITLEAFERIYAIVVAEDEERTLRSARNEASREAAKAQRGL